MTKYARKTTAENGGTYPRPVKQKDPRGTDIYGRSYPLRPCTIFRPDRGADWVIAPGETMCLCGFEYDRHTIYPGDRKPGQR